MSHSYGRIGFSKGRAALALFACVAATGCTVGEVTYEGQAVHPQNDLVYYVLFSQETASYPVLYPTILSWANPNEAGNATFSFDPNGPNNSLPNVTYQPAGAFNHAINLPAGEYTAEVDVYRGPMTGESVPVAKFTSRPFQHSYPTTDQTDAYTHTPIPTQAYDLEILAASSNCPSPQLSTGAGVVPVCASSGNTMSIAQVFF